MNFRCLFVTVVIRELPKTRGGLKRENWVGLIPEIIDKEAFKGFKRGRKKIVEMEEGIQVDCEILPSMGCRSHDTSDSFGRFGPGETLINRWSQGDCHRKRVGTGEKGLESIQIPVRGILAEANGWHNAFSP
jgi:hypothetical protein